MNKVVLPVLSILLCLVSCIGEYSFAAAQEKQGDRVLNVLNWEDYFGPTILKDFEKQYGVKVNLATFDDENMMMSMVQSSPGKYDIVVASGDQLQEMIISRLLARIDLDNIPNFKNIDRRYLRPHYDPGNNYSVPYLWGTTGLVVNRRYIKDETDSWAVLWDPRYRGKIAMLNNYDEVIGAALKRLGYSINTNDAAHLAEAQKLLLEQRPLLAGYLDPILIREKLVSNELWAAQSYSGEGVFAMDKNKALEYVIPREGTSIWVDTFMIPRDSPRRKTAELFINYLLEPKVSARNVNYLWYANCNLAARPYTLKEVLKHPGLYPGEEALGNSEFFLSDAPEEELQRGEQVRNRIWSELLRGRD